MSRWLVSIGTVATLCTAPVFAQAGPTKAECVAAHEISQRLWKADKLRKAREFLQRCASDECPEVVSRECSAWRTQANAELPRVRVEALDADGRPVALRSIVIDGELVQNPASHEVDPGQHTLIATADDGQSVTTVFVARRGDRDSPVIVRVPALPAPTPAPVAVAARTEPAPLPPAAPTIVYVPATTRLSSGARPYVWLTAASGAAALASFFWFGLSGRSKERDMGRECAPFCSQSEVDSMHRDYVVADVSLGVSVAAFAASLWILHAFREPSSPSTAPRTGSSPLSIAF